MNHGARKTDQQQRLTNPENFDIQCSLFETHLVITRIWILHSHVVDPNFFLPWNFTKDRKEE